MNWQDWLAFSRTERVGIAVVLVILAVILITPYLFKPRQPQVDYAAFEARLDTFFANLKPKDSLYYAQQHINFLYQKYDTIELFTFNPNTATEEQFVQLGLTPRQSNIIINYRSKGGKFYKKSDFSNIYSISEAQYSILEPYISIPGDESTTARNRETFEPEQLFDFDPNTATPEQWQQLGMSPYQIRNIQNYLKSGGKFYQKTDLRKIYSVTDEQYQILEPYIVITEPATTATSGNPPDRQTSAPAIIELNSATANDLKQLYGIGDVYARRIVKFRDLLGGFFKKEQLLEVYGLEQETYQNIKDRLTVDATGIQRISLNFASKYELARHPYISETDAARIVEYRSRHGSFSSISQLQQNSLVDETVYNKIKHYISVN